MRGGSPIPGRLARIAGVLVLVLATGGWDRPVIRHVAWRAMTFYPEDLARQVQRHHDRYEAGIRAGLALPPAWRAAGPGRLEAALEHQARLCRQSILKPEPLAHLVERLGTLAVLVCDANDPLAVSDADRAEARYAAEWLHYGGSVLGRVRLVYYGQDRRLVESGDLNTFVQGIFGRSRELYPFVGEEFLRGGDLRGWRQIDDRSVAFGVAGVAMSHAMTDLANLATWVWVSGGGVRPTPRPTPSGHAGPTVTVLLDGGLPERHQPRSGNPAMPPKRLRVPR